MVNFGKMMARKEREGCRIGKLKQLNGFRGSGRFNGFRTLLVLTGLTLLLLVVVSEVKSVESVVEWDKICGESYDDAHQHE